MNSNLFTVDITILWIIMKNKEVDLWFKEYEHPIKDVMLFMRDIILASNKKIEECIKWKSPTFMYKGNVASFNPRTKKHVSLMFHTGASIPGKFPSLEGSGNVARYMKVHDMEHAKKIKKELTSVFKAWCKMKDASVK